jgi:hypothetical protein
MFATRVRLLKGDTAGWGGSSRYPVYLVNDLRKGLLSRGAWNMLADEADFFPDGRPASSSLG